MRHSRQALRDIGPLREHQHRHSEDTAVPTVSVRDERPEYLIATSYPTLFPYGLGMVEDHQPGALSFVQQCCRLLKYHDRRFRTHHSFPFAVFGMQQKRQALSSARIQMSQAGFAEVARTFSTLRYEDLEKAAEEEKEGLSVSDGRIRLLRRHVSATAGRVTGSDQAWATYRSQIWGMTYALNPLSLWITINPNDLQDPIVQIFAGADIDMDNFNPLIGPDADQRARNVAHDPYAAAKYFVYLVDTILQELLGIRHTESRVTSTEGIFGLVSGYFGVVEAQGRGTLHLHLLVWLRNAPTPAQMLELLKSEQFRNRLCQFIRANIRAHVQGLDQSAVEKSVATKNVAYSRPPAPTSPTLIEELSNLEATVARSTQVHTCSQHTCLKISRTGVKHCKRRAPFPLATDDWVQENGSWGPKRSYGYLNNWCPPLVPILRSNHDIKLLTNGPETLSIFWYVTSYQTKKQNRSYNTSALLAKTVRKHEGTDQYLQDIQERNRLLLFRCINALNGETELSAPMIMMYLLGHGDSMSSHKFAPLYWGAVSGYLARVFPELKHG